MKLVVPTLLEMVIPEAPQNLVGDNAYDSDKLDSELSRYGIELISPHRRENTEGKICGDCDAIAAGGILSDCLPGFRTSADWSSGTATR